ncbi:hypothetical protein [Phaeovulum vinaykumarii]|uniref:Uncharacterized protein n=1 Tax=Phaeovulum vinaykumarii TaxID=407234 RepID=A0A1N7KAF9_9RHOB|nr:hypothetical protein [Phaeovulum vinaykumarii]SIS58598.1 hypothetical protein SAMN05421795_101761 [Phaeovulum vinaykumarii]SOB93855.1 hypothetical protein SAMN05878426_101757 [Phaeovulum vinaykumarii]
MTNDLITMLASGALAFCVIFAFGHVARRMGMRLPKWIMPAAVGVSMLVSTIWSEYSWYPRLRAALPESLVVFNPVEESAPWRPWTYLAPITTRFMAIDRDRVERLAAAPDIALAKVLLIGRWQSMQAVPTAFDCAASARADLIGGGGIDREGNLKGGAQWRPLPDGDPMLRAACDRG